MKKGCQDGGEWGAAPDEGWGVVDVDSIAIGSIGVQMKTGVYTYRSV
jgi:hypothetical protein